MVSLILFAIGTAFGSFLSVVIIRSIRDEQFLSGRSHCDHCNRTLSWYDNIPLLSFTWLRGACRYCHKPISLIHPVVEVLTGLLFVWWYLGGFLFFKLTQQPFMILQPLFWLVVGVLLLILFFTDLLYYVLPDVVVGTLLLVTVIYRASLLMAGILRPDDLLAMCALTGIVWLFFFGLWYLTKGRGMGMGDVKLVIPLTLLSGWPLGVLSTMISFIFGAVVGLVLVATGSKSLSQALPFGPFLIVATAFSLVWGDQVIQWYLRFL